MSLFLESLKLREQAVNACKKLLDLLHGHDTENLERVYKELRHAMDQLHLIKEEVATAKRRQRARHFASMGHRSPRMASNRVEHVETKRLGTCTGFRDNGTMGVTYDDNGEQAYDVTPAFRLVSET